MSVKKLKVLCLSTAFLFSGLSSAAKVQSFQESKSLVLNISLSNATYYRLIKKSISEMAKTNSLAYLPTTNHDFNLILNKELNNEIKEDIEHALKIRDKNFLHVETSRFKQLALKQLQIKSPKCSIIPGEYVSVELTQDIIGNEYSGGAEEAQRDIAMKNKEIRRCLNALIDHSAPTAGEVEFSISVDYLTRKKKI